MFERSHLAIIDLYMATEGKYNFTEIGNHAGLSKTTALKSGKLLVELGYLRKVDGGRYVYNDHYVGANNLKAFINSPEFVAPLVENKDDSKKGIFVEDKSTAENRGYAFDIVDLSS